MASTDMTDTDTSLLDGLRDLHDGSTWARLLQGALLPFKAIRFIFKNPRLWPVLIMPVLINLAIFGGGVYLLATNADAILEWLWLEPVTDAWYDWLLKSIWYVLLVVVALLSVLASYIFVLLISGVVAGPFNDILSARVERRLLDTDEIPERDESVLWGLIRTVASSIFILGSYCVVMAPILMLNLVPGFGQIAATFLGAGVSSMFLTMEIGRAHV